MRLIITALFFFLCFIGNVSASDVYYSRYSDFKNYEEKIVIDSDLINIVKKRMFKYFWEEKTGDYFLINENPSSYPYLDESNYIIKSFTDWDYFIPEEKINRVVESKDIYQYREMKEVRYIHFNNFLGGNNRLNITEIKVMAGDNVVNYSVYCEGCNNNFNTYVNNFIVHEVKSHVSLDGYIRLDLNDYYPLDSLKVYVYFFDDTTFEKRISIYYTRDEELQFDGNTNIYAHNLVRSFFTHKSNDEIHELVFDINFVLFKNPEFTELKYSEHPVNSSKTRSVNKTKLYRYQDTYFYYYDLIKNYLDGYYESNPDYIKDENNYIDYLIYQTRDRLIIDKDIIINNDNITVDDFIKSTSSYEILGDIDYSKNGVYQIKVLFDNLEIDRSVYVDKRENINEENNILEDESLTVVKKQSDKFDKKNKNEIKVSNKNNEKGEENLKYTNYFIKEESEKPVINNYTDKIIVNEKNSKGKFFFMFSLILLIISLIILIVFLVKKNRINNNSTFVETV